MNRHTRRALLKVLSAAPLLTACAFSFNFTIELPRIKIQADKLTAWVVNRLGHWAPPSLINAVTTENAKVQALKPDDGWGPLLRDVMTEFVRATGVVLQAASIVASVAFPALGPLITIAQKVVTALSAFSNLAGAGDIPTLDQSEGFLKDIGA